MKIEEAIDILENIIDDEVIGTYCVEIQKEGVNCSKNCEDKDCYLSEAIRTIVNYIDKLQEENEELENTLKQTQNSWFKDAERLDKLQKENKALGRTLDDEIADNDRLQEENAELKRKTYKVFINDKGEVEFVFDNHISKDKIRAKIKELEETSAKELRYDFLMNRDEIKSAFIRILEELLN